MKKVLLIGGAGYVGSVLSSYFLRKGYFVTVLDNFIYNNQFSVTSFIGNPNYEIVRGEMGNYSDLDKVSKDANDVIILSGLVGDPITKKYPKESEIINDKSLKNALITDNKHINKLIFISTCSNYGLIKDNELADENFELSPLSTYAKAKVSNEEYS